MRRNILIGSCLLVALSAWTACVSDGSSSSSSGGGSSSGDSGAISSTSGAPVEAGGDVTPFADGGSDADAAPQPFCVQNAGAFACEDFEGGGNAFEAETVDGKLTRVTDGSKSLNAMEALVLIPKGVARFTRPNVLPSSYLSFDLKPIAMKGTARLLVISKADCTQCEMFIRITPLAGTNDQYELTYVSGGDTKLTTKLGTIVSSAFSRVSIDLSKITTTARKVGIEVNGTQTEHVVADESRPAPDAQYNVSIGATVFDTGATLSVALDNLLIKSSK
jgi:hypothetical protein